jgi:hypothetical protein
MISSLRRMYLVASMMLVFTAGALALGEAIRIFGGLVPIISAIPYGNLIFGVAFTAIGFWLLLWAIIGLPIAIPPVVQKKPAHGYDPVILKTVRQGF